MKIASAATDDAIVPKRRQRHYSYDEGLNEPEKLIADERVEIEHELPAEENEKKLKGMTRQDRLLLKNERQQARRLQVPRRSRIWRFVKQVSAGIAISREDRADVSAAGRQQLERVVPPTGQPLHDEPRER